MVWAVLVDCSLALLPWRRVLWGEGANPSLTQGGGRPLRPRRKEGTLKQGGGRGAARGRGWQKSFCRCKFTALTPFSSPLHMNNKKPVWQLSNSQRQCVWLRCVCVCVLWQSVVSCCYTATPRRILQKNEEAFEGHFLCVSVARSQSTWSVYIVPTASLLCPDPLITFL